MGGMAGWKDHFKRAIAIKGSQPKLAKAIGCSQSKISWLLCVAKQIDAEDALAVDRATGGAVSKSQLRPDLWAPDARARGAA